MQYAPIALFAYERLNHLKRAISSLQNNLLAKDSELYIFSDAGKTTESIIKVANVRSWIKQITGFKKIHIITRDHNLGLANSIIQGVTELTHHYGKVIVVEDDLIVSPFFLSYMNEALTLYQHEAQVASIHGYTFPLKEKMPETYFVRGADCWGWATWKRAWDKFEPDGNKLLGILQKKGLQKIFDYQGTQPYMQMLKDQINGKNNSWAIRWHASAFVNNMLTLYPGRSLVQNTGLDNSGEHCVATSILDVPLTASPILLNRLPIEKNAIAYHAFVRYFKSLREPFYKKVIRKIQRHWLLRSYYA